MCGGTTHPRMTTGPTLILSAMARAVTTAELTTLLMLRRMLLFAYPPFRAGKSTAPDQSVYISCAAPPRRLSDPDLGMNQRNRERYSFR